MAYTVTLWYSDKHIPPIQKKVVCLEELNISKLIRGKLARQERLQNLTLAIASPRCVVWLPHLFTKPLLSSGCV
ncbi:hypothetical protein J6590_014440 [Homalodisca vitripennis]|nr:hypothetical protein J6590_014440 [Homalodisca vitripennis]